MSSMFDFICYWQCTGHHLYLCPAAKYNGRLAIFRQPGWKNMFWGVRDVIYWFYTKRALVGCECGCHAWTIRTLVRARSASPEQANCVTIRIVACNIPIGKTCTTVYSTIASKPRSLICWICRAATVEGWSTVAHVVECGVEGKVHMLRALVLQQIAR